LLLLALLPLLAVSQDLPPIVKYAPTTYDAGNQNWMISQDQNHYIFFANNEGLLEYNGSNSMYQSPNETIIRSVKVVENKIYGMLYGVWVLVAPSQRAVAVYFAQRQDQGKTARRRTILEHSALRPMDDF
jgi:ligand-binding sensor domain-containing protein